MSNEEAEIGPEVEDDRDLEESREQKYEEHVPLKCVLRDYLLFKKFKDFIMAQHAGENLLFYLAVTKFARHTYTQPNKELQQIIEEASNSPRNPKNMAKVSQVDNTRMHINMAKTYKLPMARVGVICDALKIYEVFIQDGAACWVCLAPKTRKAVSDILLKEPEKTRQNIFTKAAQEAYIDMEKDVLPRFLNENIGDKDFRERVNHYTKLINHRQKSLTRGQSMGSFRSRSSTQRSTSSQFSAFSTLKRKSISLVKAMTAKPSSSSSNADNEERD